jgi:CelD/BcsL family acetyltransferase involved in cellulose biosynthesis
MPETIEETPNPMLCLPAVCPSETAFAATLPATFADFAGARSADFFRQNRYKWRRLAKLGAVEVRFPSDQAERDQIMQVAAEQKTEWLTHYGLPNLFARPEVREFYKRLTNTPFQTGGIVVASLRVGQRIVATMWGSRFRDRYCFLLSSYDKHWSQFSVGRLLMESVVQWCISQRDVKVFDLTVGHEAYKLHWSDHMLSLHQQVHARTPKGAAVVAYRQGRAQLANYHQVRKLVRALRRAFRARPGFARRRA